MTLGEGLRYKLANTAGVTDLVSTRIWPLRIPQDADLPAIAYQQISGPREYSHGGAVGLCQARVQITIQGKSYRQAMAVAQQMRITLEAFSGTWDDLTVTSVFLANEYDGWAQTLGAAVVRQDYLIRFEE